MFGLIEKKSVGVTNLYRVTDQGALIGVHALQERPGIGDEPMAPAGRFYLERRLVEIEAELLAAETDDGTAASELVDNAG
ncbi:hypothetical protein [Pseudofrankia sp. BMG5.36]|uniref:hypothetical protein n=1 Tax=Pseudofrankia sp. BMG5.36 TaxID=1834512 RepID=UPI0008D8D939|nr:hypothetical protein [Pseudofrankia sp. BMG5.36]OHV61408.1 hypothetical protein BCD48_39780 [Pseudofrankia sp. BMG5.36]